MMRAGLATSQKFQIRNPKSQGNSKPQISNPLGKTLSALVIENWSFFRIWSLGFGTSALPRGLDLRVMIPSERCERRFISVQHESSNRRQSGEPLRRRAGET